MPPSSELQVEVITYFLRGNTFQYDHDLDPVAFGEGRYHVQRILEAVFEMKMDGLLLKPATNVKKDRMGHYSCSAMTCQSAASLEGKKRFSRYIHILDNARTSGKPISRSKAWDMSYSDSTTRPL